MKNGPTASDLADPCGIGGRGGAETSGDHCPATSAHPRA